MLVEHIIMALVSILMLSLLAQPISQWLRLPYASILVLLGYITSELLVYVGIDTGIRAENFQAIIFYVFIPILVFEAAYNLDKQQLKNNFVVILFLAIIAMFLTCLIVAYLLFHGIGHESGFPWIAALIAGSILAATDPAAVVARLKEVNAPERINVLLEGESLFNDATSIVLFTLFVSIAVAMSAQPVDVSYSIDVLIEFFSIFIGGALTGAAIGLLFGYLQKIIKRELLSGVISLVVAYGSFMLAEYLSVSGVMSTLFAALSFSILAHQDVDPEESAKENATNNVYLWDVLSHVASVSVFIVMGAVITLEMFEQRWLAMLIAIFALIIARAVSVYGVLLVFSAFKNLKVSFAAQTVMVWGGLRGAVTLALALSIPTELEYWWTIQSIAFGVVMFSLFVQAPTMQIVAKRLLKGSSD